MNSLSPESEQSDGPSIVPPVARQARRLSWIPRLSSLLRSFLKDLLLWRLPTLGLGITRVAVRRLEDHPRLLGWVGAPESACLLSQAPSEWIRSMTRVQTLDAARQLQRDACLMTSNLSVLDQYAIRSTSSPSATIPAVGSSPVESALAVNSLSPESEQSDGPSIVPPVARQARRLSWIPRLSSLLRSFLKDLLLWRLPTLGLGITRVAVRPLEDHPRLLGWVGAPESACLLSQAPSEWIRSMTRVQTLDAARQLQRDACLMTSNLSVLDQYAICLHGMAS